MSAKSVPIVSRYTFLGLPPRHPDLECFIIAVERRDFEADRREHGRR